MVVPATACSGRGVRTKQVNLSSTMRILRSKTDLEQFLEAEKPRLSPEHHDELEALSDYVLHGHASNVNKTKQTAEPVRAHITVPSTVLHKDATIDSLGFLAPNTYIRFIQHRHSQTGIRLFENTAAHYSLYKPDFEFVENFNKRCPETPITLEELCLLMDAFEKGAIKCPREKTFTYDLALLAAREHGNATPAYLIREVHSYWSDRRKDHVLPLVRHLWPVTLMWESSAFPVFRPRTKDKMLLRRPRRSKVESILRLFSIIDGFRKVLKLLYKMRQRDEKKLMLAQLEIVLFDQRLHERDDESYVCPFWRSIMDQKRSRALKKIRGELNKKESNTDSITSSMKSLHNMQLSGQFWSSPPQADESIPDNANYSSLRVSRRIGRGGRLWIDRRRVYNQENVREHPYKHALSFLSDEDSGDDTEHEYVNLTNRTGDFNVYTNHRNLESHPGFACTYEAVHPYNNGGMFHYQLPEYFVRQIEIIKLLDAILPPRNDNNSRRLRGVGTFEGCA